MAFERLLRHSKGLWLRIWVSGPIGDSLLKKIQSDVQALRVPLASPKPRVCVSSRSARKGKCIIEGSQCRAFSLAFRCFY